MYYDTGRETHSPVVWDVCDNESCQNHPNSQAAKHGQLEEKVVFLSVNVAESIRDPILKSSSTLLLKFTNKQMDQGYNTYVYIIKLNKIIN